jgi:hypothetical protein
MSKLRDNPAKVVPMRALTLAFLLTGVIGGLSIRLDFNLWLTLAFFWLGTMTNMIAFRLIVVGAERMITKREAGEKATIIPNLMIRYVMYIAVLGGAWFIGGLIPSIAAIIGVQMSQIVIKLDSFVG